LAILLFTIITPIVVEKNIETVKKAKVLLKQKLKEGLLLNP